MYVRMTASRFEWKSLLNGICYDLSPPPVDDEAGSNDGEEDKNSKRYPDNHTGDPYMRMTEENAVWTPYITKTSVVPLIIVRRNSS
jgi:hypothetical protein